jgi:ABC-type uncharacterized transport system substrate-binding protein
MKRRKFIALIGGTAAAWPLAAHAQQMRSPYRIGFLGLLPGENTSTFMKSFLERLNEFGYREGYNMIFDYRSAEGVPERLPQLAADAVRASPDVLVTGMGTLAARRRRQQPRRFRSYSRLWQTLSVRDWLQALADPAPTSPG